MPDFAISPDVLRWAIDGSPYAEDEDSLECLHQKCPKLTDWLNGSKRPTFAQLKDFAKKTHVPLGYLFLDEPPEESLPIADMRTMGDQQIKTHSRNLLDTISLCQNRQDWYRDFSESCDATKLPFVGSVVARKDNYKEVAAEMRRSLNFSLEERAHMKTREEALQQFIGKAEDLGVLVMVSGVVGNNNKRKLNEKEFRGFALCDDLAPLVFINAVDAGRAQMFTLAHELAHIWLGESALSNISVKPDTNDHSQAEEKWCNQVAAELLVPMSDLCREHDRHHSLDVKQRVVRLAGHFKVSETVILRRLSDARVINREELDKLWKSIEPKKDMLKEKKNRGGDFYLTEAKRVSHRFARALLFCMFNRQTTYTEASRLLGIKKVETLRKLADRLGLEKRIING